MEVSDIIAAVALIFTIILGMYGFFLTKKINKINLNSYMFNQLFSDILFEMLPQALEDAYRTQLKALDKLEDMMIELNNKIKCYKYVDKKFYSELYNQVTKIDEFVVLTKGKSKFDGFEESKKLESEVEKLYGIFMKKYIEKG